MGCVKAKPKPGLGCELCTRLGARHGIPVGCLALIRGGGHLGLHALNLLPSMLHFSFTTILTSIFTYYYDQKILINLLLLAKPSSSVKCLETIFRLSLALSINEGKKNNIC